MKRVIFYASIALLTLTISCNKNDDSELGQTDLVDPDFGYIPFYPGNYWIYEHYSIDSLGNETLMDVYDSVFISGTISIQNTPYLVFEGTWMSGPQTTDTVLMLRDSAGYYVDPSGWVHFSNNNFTDTLASLVYEANGQILYSSWYKMETQPDQVTVPAGTYNTVNYKGTILTANPGPGIDDYRYKDRLYAKNVGQVLDTYFYLMSPTRMERRLVKYYVDKNSSVH